MADFDYESVFVYTRAGSSDNVQSDNGTDITGTVSGGNSDSDTIAQGTNITDQGSVVGTFYGSYTGDSGTVYMVVQVDADTFYVYSPNTVAESSSDLPKIIDSDADIDTTDPMVVCFTAGTLIAIPGGETAVEDLQIGDMILTAEGKTVPVKWIGRRKMMKLFTPADRLRPVRVTAGALGNGLPHTDLLLTADHALIIDGLAINASALVNGTTIAFEPMDSLPDQFTYFHVETEDHNVILANGAPAETYCDYVARSAFDNHGEYLALYGSEKIITEMPMPRISAARMLPDAIRAKLQGAEAA